MGHPLKEEDTFGFSQILIRKPDGSLDGATDPRCVGLAAGTR